VIGNPDRHRALPQIRDSEEAVLPPPPLGTSRPNWCGSISVFHLFEEPVHSTSRLSLVEARSQVPLLLSSRVPRIPIVSVGASFLSRRGDRSISLTLRSYLREDVSMFSLFFSGPELRCYCFFCLGKFLSFFETVLPSLLRRPTSSFVRPLRRSRACSFLVNSARRDFVVAFLLYPLPLDTSRIFFFSRLPSFLARTANASSLPSVFNSNLFSPVSRVYI